jgi:hypothetical protein
VPGAGGSRSRQGREEKAGRVRPARAPEGHWIGMESERDEDGRKGHAAGAGWLVGGAGRGGGGGCCAGFGRGVGVGCGCNATTCFSAISRRLTVDLRRVPP